MSHIWVRVAKVIDAEKCAEITYCGKISKYNINVSMVRDSPLYCHGKEIGEY